MYSHFHFTVLIFIKDVEGCKIKPPGKSEPYVMAKRARHEGGRLQYIGGGAEHFDGFQETIPNEYFSSSEWAAMNTGVGKCVESLSG